MLPYYYWEVLDHISKIKFVLFIFILLLLIVVTSLVLQINFDSCVFTLRKGFFKKVFLFFKKNVLFWTILNTSVGVYKNTCWRKWSGVLYLQNFRGQLRLKSICLVVFLFCSPWYVSSWEVLVQHHRWQTNCYMWYCDPCSPVVISRTRRFPFIFSRNATRRFAFSKTSSPLQFHA